MILTNYPKLEDFLISLFNNDIFYENVYIHNSNEVEMQEKLFCLCIA